MLCVMLCVGVHVVSVVWSVVCVVVVWHAENSHVWIQHAPVCTFKTSKCMPATRAHVESHLHMVIVPPLSQHKQTHTKHNTDTTSHGDKTRESERQRQRQSEDREREREKKMKEEREETTRRGRGRRKREKKKKKKKSVLTCTRGGMYMSVSLFAHFLTKKRSLEHLLSAVSSTFSDFKPYLMSKRKRL